MGKDAPQNRTGGSAAYSGPGAPRTLETVQTWRGFAPSWFSELRVCQDRRGFAYTAHSQTGPLGSSYWRRGEHESWRSVWLDGAPAKLRGGFAQCCASQSQPLPSDLAERTTPCNGCQQDDRDCSQCGTPPSLGGWTSGAIYSEDSSQRAASWWRWPFPETGREEEADKRTCLGAFSQESRASYAPQFDRCTTPGYRPAAGYELCGRRSRRIERGSFPRPRTTGWLTSCRPAPRTQAHLPVPFGRLVGQFTCETASLSPGDCDPVGQCTGNRAFVCVAFWCLRSHCSASPVCTVLWLSLRSDAFDRCLPVHHPPFKMPAEIQLPLPYPGGRLSSAFGSFQPVAVPDIRYVLVVPCPVHPGARLPRVSFLHPNSVDWWTNPLQYPGARFPRVLSFSLSALASSPECSAPALRPPSALGCKGTARAQNMCIGCSGTQASHCLTLSLSTTWLLSGVDTETLFVFPVTRALVSLPGYRIPRIQSFVSLHFWKDGSFAPCLLFSEQKSLLPVFVRLRVHKSRIGCSGSATASATPALDKALLWLSFYMPMFFIQLLLASCFVLLRVFLVQLGFKRRLLGRCLIAPLQGPFTCVLLAWGSISCVHPNVHSAHHSRCRPASGRRKANQFHGSPFLPSVLWNVWLLAFLSCPVQVWAAPEPWGEAVDIILEAVRLFPEPIPAQCPPTGSNVPFWARPGFEPERIQEPATVAPVLDHPDIPVPPHAEELPDTNDRRFVQAYCYVMSPHYQAEVVPLHLGIPTDMQTFCTYVRRSLSSLRLRFVSEIIPTVPQLSSEFASILVVPKWLNASNRQVIVYDLRPCGGPVYPDYVHDRVTYGECLAVGRQHSIDECAIYAQGHTQPLCPGSSFLAVSGGVVQFQPVGTPAEWRSPLHSRFDMPNDWLGDPTLPEEELEWPLYVSHHDAFSLCTAERFPDGSAAQAIAGLVDRRPSEALFVTSPGRQLEDVCVRGASCRDVMAVFPVTPSADRTGVLVFLDFRQIGLWVTHLYVDPPAIAPTDIILRHHLRAPPGYKITCWPRPDQSGRIPVVEGDVLLLGFVPDSWDSDDEFDTDSTNSSSHPASEESSSQAQRAASPHAGESPLAPTRPRTGGSDTHRADRSRSPRGSEERHASVTSGDIVSIGVSAARITWSSTVQDSLARGEATTSEASFQVYHLDARQSDRKWSPGTRQQTIDDGALEITPTVDFPAHAQTLLTFSPACEPLSASDTLIRKAPATMLVAPEVEPVRAYRLLEHKFLIEPGSTGSDPRRSLDDLRFITIELGGAWPYHSPFNGRVPGALRDFEEDETDSHPLLCWVPVLVLKCLYVPEKLSVAIGLPATPHEAIAAIQGGTAPHCFQGLPALDCSCTTAFRRGMRLPCQSLLVWF